MGEVVLNPWAALQRAQYVLPSDVAAVQQFNRRRSESHPHYLHDGLTPVPFVGNPFANLVALTANPSLGTGGLADVRAEEAGPYGDALRGSLSHSLTDYPPFFFVDPAFASTSGAEYWVKRFRDLICATSLQVVGSNVLEVEYHPYRSRKFNSRPGVPSQSYSRYLVEAAIDRGAVIVGMRSRAVWETAVPRLRHYPSVFWLTNHQTPYLSRNQLPGGRFETVVAALLGVTPARVG